jgi:hypothetical protein
MIRGLRHRVTRRYHNILESRRGTNLLILLSIFAVGLIIVGTDLLALHPIQDPVIKVQTSASVPGDHIRYSCLDGKYIDAEYDMVWGERLVKLNLSDGRAFSMGHIQSDEGDVYARIGRATRLVRIKDHITLIERAETTYDCVALP